MAAALLASLRQCEGQHDWRCIGKRRRLSHSRQALKPSFSSTVAVTHGKSNQANCVLLWASSCRYLVTYKGLKPWSICSWTAEHLRWMLAPPTRPHFSHFHLFHHLWGHAYWFRCYFSLIIADLCIFIQSPKTSNDERMFFPACRFCLTLALPWCCGQKNIWRMCRWSPKTVHSQVQVCLTCSFGTTDGKKKPFRRLKAMEWLHQVPPRGDGWWRDCGYCCSIRTARLLRFWCLLSCMTSVGFNGGGFVLAVWMLTWLLTS